MAHIHKFEINDDDLNAIRRTQELVRDVVDGIDIPVETIVRIAIRSAEPLDLAGAVVASLHHEDPNQLSLPDSDV